MILSREWLHADYNDKVINNYNKKFIETILDQFYCGATKNSTFTNIGEIFISLVNIYHFSNYNWERSVRVSKKELEVKVTITTKPKTNCLNELLINNI